MMGDKHRLHTIILSPGTNVFLILMACYESLPLATYFSIEAPSYERNINVKLLLDVKLFAAI